MSNIEKMQEALKARRESGEENTTFINAIDKWDKSPKTSRKLAINAMCANCMGCTSAYSEPGYRALIADCSSGECPLYEFRPYQKWNKPHKDVQNTNRVRINTTNRVRVNSRVHFGVYELWADR